MSIPFPALMGTAEQILIVSDKCPWEDQSSGIGGQSGSCTFQCSYPGTASLEVRADDGDATVTGSGKCVDVGLLTCSGKKSCSDSELTNKAGDGVCNGESDEAIDSGLRVNCYSNTTNVPPPPVPNEWCPVVIRPNPPYPAFCIKPNPWQQSCPDDMICSLSIVVPLPEEICLPGEICEDVRAIRFPLDTCKVVRTNGVTLCGEPEGQEQSEDFGALSEHVGMVFAHDTSTSSAQIIAKAGLATGFVCYGAECVQVMPDCTTQLAGGRTRCSI